jgi:hypothetical protein
MIGFAGQTPRKENLSIDPCSHHIEVRDCYLCKEPLDFKGTALYLGPTLQAHKHVLGDWGVGIHTACLVDTAKSWGTLNQGPARSHYIQAKDGSMPALVLHQDWVTPLHINQELGFRIFGDFAPYLKAEYDEKGCMACHGHGHAPGLVLDFGSKDKVIISTQRFRMIHIDCVEGIYMASLPPGWDAPADKMPLLRGLAELVSLT